MTTGVVFNIQKCSIHDGPGLRTLVFMKGCPLRCLWCANPESQRYESELIRSASKCIDCGACVDKCGRGCIGRGTDGYTVDFGKCDNCGECVGVCHAQSLEMVGEEKSVDVLMDLIMRDRAYYQRSGGGVTFSGGEPLTQPEFLLAMVRKCRENRVHVTVETCGCGDYGRFAPVIPYVDLFFFDLKHADPDTHRKLTGVSQDGILANLRHIDRDAEEMIIRIPLIPGLNDDADNLSALARIIAPLSSVRKVELMPYHALGASKYAMLGREYPLAGMQTPSPAECKRCVAVMNAVLTPAGKTCFVEE